jgi:hypothetical protein
LGVSTRSEGIFDLSRLQNLKARLAELDAVHEQYNIVFFERRSTQNGFLGVLASIVPPFKSEVKMHGSQLPSAVRRRLPSPTI